MSVYFVLEFRIFVMMESINGVYYFALKIFVMMRNTSDVLFLCLINKKIKQETLICISVFSSLINFIYF